MAMKKQNILLSADQLVHSSSHQSQDLQTLKALSYAEETVQLNLVN